MFREIRIRGVGVIDDAVLELSPGLNVLTGETGAGKTMVVSGLGLLLGARADSGLVRAAGETALVEGLVGLPDPHPARSRAQEAGAEVDDDLVLARTVTREGRSRAHVGGRSTPVGLLGELGELLVAVHGQADQWRLRHADQHRQVLDDFGGEQLGALRATYEARYDELVAAVAERDRLRRVARERAREVDVLRAGLERIEAVDPQPGEDARLRAEDQRLGHADSLRLAADSAHRTLSDDDPYSGDGAVPSVVAQVSAARAALGPVTAHDPQLRALDERLGEVGYLVADLSADLASYLAGIDTDPERLEAVQRRRAELAGLTRAYGDTVDDVLAWSREAAATLEEILGADDRVEELERRSVVVREELGVAAAALSEARKAAAARLAEQVTEELGHLAMGRAQLEVGVRRHPDPDGLLVPGVGSGVGSGAGEPVRFGRQGVDEVEILLTAGPGTPARNVARAASGGELSRVMLALEVVTGGSGSSVVPTFVFDEVDAGVGGRAALDVGARLARLARTAQVIVVTHLAQVAVFADRHLVVHKDDAGAVTSSSVAPVEGDARLGELSRMMGGDPESPAGLEHARELLGQATALRDRPPAAAPGRPKRRATSTKRPA